VSELPGWNEEIHGSIKALVVLVGDRLPLLTTSEDYPLVRQYAAAYLARVRRIVIGMDVLYEAEMPDLIGGLLRICFEAWIVGMWVLCVREDAVNRLIVEHPVRSNRLIDRADIPVEPLEEIEGRQTPSLADMARAVEAALVEEGDGHPGELMWSYELVYGGVSNAGVHASLASILGHLEDQGNRVAVLATRTEANNGSGKLLWAAPLLAMLARRVFLEFGVGVEDLDRTAEPIQRLAVELNERFGPQGND